MTKEELSRPSVTSLFKNQGIYNAFLALFLLYGLYISHNSDIVTFFVLFVMGFAAYGAVPSNNHIMLPHG